jgi:hypothetical protein
MIMPYNRHSVKVVFKAFFAIDLFSRNADWIALKALFLEDKANHSN